MLLQGLHFLWVKSESAIFVDLGKLLRCGVGSDLHVFDICVGGGIGVDECRSDWRIETEAFNYRIGK